MADVDLGPASVARVREAADIVEVVGDHVRLTRRGRRWVGLCPFHEEKTPSFSVDPERGLYYCFGCHAGGDTIRFVMEMENLDFPAAVELLARRFGVELPRRTPGARRRSEEAEKIRGLLDEAQRYFAERLRAAEGAAARRELERRGFGPETWETFGFGYAPDAWDGLLKHLLRRHTQGAIVNAGLAVVGERSGRPYDRFRKRITFPIRGTDGRLVAFGGRALGDDEPKYLNSPEGPLFHKRSTLFMLAEARRFMAEAGHAVVVEGYFDCLSLHRVGIRQAVATLGTALTPEHARLLRRLAPRVLLCYDGDAAGRKAAVTGAEVLLGAGVETAIVVLPPGQDPDDIVRERGSEGFRALLEEPTPVLDFLLADMPADPRSRRRVGAGLAPMFGAIPDAVMRYSLLEELARRLDLPLDVLQEHARRRPSGASRREADPSRPRGAGLPPGERELIRILLECDASWRQRILPVVDVELLESTQARRIVELLRSARGDVAADAVRALVDAADDPALVQVVAELSMAESPPLSETGIRSQVNVLLKRQAELRSRALQPLIEAAVERGDDEEVARLQEEKRRIRLERPSL